MRRTASKIQNSSYKQNHELVSVFAQYGYALNSTLTDMLNEHHTHQTERRGCGFTQATRYLADFINRPRHPDVFDDLTLFREGPSQQLQSVYFTLNNRTEQTLSWRHLDHQVSTLKTLLTSRADVRLRRELEQEAECQSCLRRIVGHLQQEESRILAALLISIILPDDASAGMTTLSCYPEKLPIGTCTLAEKYFLELAHRHMKRGAKMNIILGQDGQPILLEKVNFGDSHSCLSLAPVLLNDIRIPSGSLLGVAYADAILEKRPTDTMPGHMLAAERCDGFRFLRLTTLAVEPVHRTRAFTTQIEAQREKGFFDPIHTNLGQLVELARLLAQKSVEKKVRSSRAIDKTRIRQGSLRYGCAW